MAVDVEIEPTVVVSRDGTRAVEVVRCDGIERMPNRTATGAYFACRTARGAEEARVVVMFSYTMFAVLGQLDVPASSDEVTNIVQMALAALGEHLDSAGALPPTPPGETATPVECFSYQIDAWRKRPRATDEEVERYLENHLYTAWGFNHEGVLFGVHDLIRLHTDTGDLTRIALLNEGARWTLNGVVQGHFRLRATPEWLREERKRRSSGRQAVSTPGPTPARAYIAEARLSELRGAQSTAFDLRKLIRLCEELNGCFSIGYYFAVAMLARAILDHVPPIFGVRTFGELANNYPGTKSFKESMAHLNNSARKIADAHLHTHVRPQESLPNDVQVDCARDLDVLLSEVGRVLRSGVAQVPPPATG